MRQHKLLVLIFVQLALSLLVMAPRSSFTSQAYNKPQSSITATDTTAMDSDGPAMIALRQEAKSALTALQLSHSVLDRRD